MLFCSVLSGIHRFGSNFFLSLKHILWPWLKSQGLCPPLPAWLLPPPLPPPSLKVLPSHPLSPLIHYSPPHLLLHSIPLLSTGICLGISRWKLYSISGAPYQHTIIMGNHAEQRWIQLGLTLWWHYWLQGPATAGGSLLHTCITPPSLSLFVTHSRLDMDREMIKVSFFKILLGFHLNQEVRQIRNVFFRGDLAEKTAATSNGTNPVILSHNLLAFAHQCRASFRDLQGGFPSVRLSINLSQIWWTLCGDSHLKFQEFGSVKLHH